MAGRSPDTLNGREASAPARNAPRKRIDHRQPVRHDRVRPAQETWSCTRCRRLSGGGRRNESLSRDWPCAASRTREHYDWWRSAATDVKRGRQRAGSRATRRSCLPARTNERLLPDARNPQPDVVDANGLLRLTDEWRPRRVEPSRGFNERYLCSAGSGLDACVARSRCPRD